MALNVEFDVLAQLGAQRFQRVEQLRRCGDQERVSLISALNGCDCLGRWLAVRRAKYGPENVAGAPGSGSVS